VAGVCRAFARVLAFDFDLRNGAAAGGSEGTAAGATGFLVNLALRVLAVDGGGKAEGEQAAGGLDLFSGADTIW
jgi:hypothetical protein